MISIDPTLAEVAADVAAALGLLESISRDGSYYLPGVRYPVLWMNGSNLTEPYWRCACEDWLHSRYLIIHLRAGIMHHVCPADNFMDVTEVQSSLAEAPARLVSAVWRRMQQEK